MKLKFEKTIKQTNENEKTNIIKEEPSVQAFCREQNALMKGTLYYSRMGEHTT